MPDRDGESHLDVEVAWTGRRVKYGEEFVLPRGEEVGFGDHTPVLEWCVATDQDRVHFHRHHRDPPEPT